MADAKMKCVTLRPPDFSVPIDELKSAVSKNTRAILINTPHNPTGKMFTREELEVIASLCIENDVLVFTDEVYDKLAFEMDHISMASLPGMYERTVTLNSLGKTFSLTGWKIGWAIAPPHLTWGVRQAHSFLTFATSTPMQYAAAAALRAPDSYYEELKRDFGKKEGYFGRGVEGGRFYGNVDSLRGLGTPSGSCRPKDGTSGSEEPEISHSSRGRRICCAAGGILPEKKTKDVKRTTEGLV
ncbi:hypothetical protein RJ639_029401 [Escallonia herrerae]|uniref:Aminotransferase class I/classII large domain-containing protein n=1 Tax=Escallonia herrerae TaxID=1293975 RepID=A0AA89BF88_9ASTE|nr:hypothetical protein RJ639_029401 [Escallonia herrerae]